MRKLDKQKELYIKERLQKDDLISKKADDVFNNFFKEEIKMNNETENITNINTPTKDKKLKRKQILAIVASLMVMFLAVNGYAATQGYNNIFFIIRNLIVHGEVTNPDEILTDRETIISYQPIKIANGLEIQIRKLVVKDNEAVLYLEVNEAENIEVYPNIYIVYDTTENKTEIGNQKTTRETANQDYLAIRYEEEIKLKELSNKTKKLQLEIKDKDENNISTIEIDLENKEIDILNGMEVEMKKISEVELKEFLSEYVNLNSYKDGNIAYEIDVDKQKFLNEVKVQIAADLIYKKETDNLTNENDNFDIVYTQEKINKAIKEYMNEDITDVLDLANMMIYYNEEKKAYDYYPGDGFINNALCLNISNISFSNGIYTVDFTYCYPTEGDYTLNNIENLDIYSTTMKFKLNDNYEYTKYCLVNANELESDKIENNNESEKTQTEITNTTDTTTVETIVTPPNNQEAEINNYASTMEWSEYWAPGIKVLYPTEWDLKELGEDVRGSNPGQPSTSITGVATGIDKETNTIVNSNVIITIYEPEFLEVNSLEEYYEHVEMVTGGKIQGEFNANNSGEWLEVHSYWGEPDGGTRHIVDYYHYESTVDREFAIGHRIRMYSDNHENFKLINIMNWILGDLRITSY